MLKVVKNAQVVTERGIIWDGVIVIENGKIKDFGEERDVIIPENAEIIDANGAYVGPGFVDIHVHGGDGKSTCFQPIEAAEHFLKRGTTSLLGTPDYHMSTEKLVEAIKSIREGMKKSRVIKGIYMEGPYTNPNHGSHSATNPWHGGVEEKDYKVFVDEGGTDVKVWTVDPERDDLKPFFEYARKVNPDVKIAIGHTQAWPMHIRRYGTKYKPTILTHAMNATHQKRIFEAGVRNYGVDEYCMKEPEMYAELISDSCGIHVDPEMQQLLIHTKGIDKVVLVTDSTIHNNVPPEHLSHVSDLNFDPQGGIAGSKMTMDQACRNIMQSTNCGIAQAFLMASTNPAKAIGMDDEIGSIDFDKNADLVFVDDRFNVQKVMLEGEIVVEKGELV